MCSASVEALDLTLTLGELYAGPSSAHGGTVAAGARPGVDRRAPPGARYLTAPFPGRRTPPSR